MVNLTKGLTRKLLIIFPIMLIACISDYMACDTDNDVYNALLNNHDIWLEQLYDMGQAPIGGRGILFKPGVLIYALGTDGYPLRYEEWQDNEKMIVVATGELRTLDNRPVGEIGSFGYIYTKTGDLTRVFPNYKFQMLAENTFCYELSE